LKLGVPLLTAYSTHTFSALKKSGSIEAEQKARTTADPSKFSALKKSGSIEAALKDLAQLVGTPNFPL